jgi:glycosyltransferase involved in cell wall biosynthesis
MSGPSSPVALASVGPPDHPPCGIGDYRRRLETELGRRSDCLPLSYAESLSDPRAQGRALLVHYERSRVLGPHYLADLARRHPGRVFVIPHEVYGEDPFALPYAALGPPFLWLKRLRYRWTHREYGREKALQAAAYHAHRVIPLSGEGFDLLRAVVRDGFASRILDPVPHARFDPAPADPPSVRRMREALFPSGPRMVIGIFGFLNPASDYDLALDLAAALGPSAALVFLGGDRGASGRRAALEADIARRGLQGKVKVTGWIPEGEVPDRLGMCDLFLAPMRFKSNSGSLLQLLGLGKPLFAPDLPLTRWLAAQGAPLDLYAGPEDLRSKAGAVLAGAYAGPADRYPWDFGRVAEAYLAAIRSASASP